MDIPLFVEQDAGLYRYPRCSEEARLRPISRSYFFADPKSDRLLDDIEVIEAAGQIPVLRIFTV